MKILWNLLCQYNNIYANSYKYLRKKNTHTHTHKSMIEKKKIYIYIYIHTAIVATMSIEQTKRHYSNAHAD